MNKTLLITKREYLSRVSKKSFIIMTLLGPVLIALFYGALIYITINDGIGSEEKKIAVFDRSGKFGQLEDQGTLHFELMSGNPDSLGDKSEFFGWLMIPPADSWGSKPAFDFYSENSLSIQHRSQIENAFESLLQQESMEKAGLSQSFIDSLKTDVQVESFRVDESGNSEVAKTEINTAIGLAMSFAIYMFIFLYGVQVMRGVIEEKTNRIVELIVSTVRPFELMLGKVLGIALVGLTQMLIWIVLSLVLISVVMAGIGLQDLPVQEMSQQAGSPAGFSSSMLSAFLSLNFPLILGGFLFYFLGGYLTYSALFAAIGSAVDTETDTQQFMLPITLPLVFAIALSTSVLMRDPNGSMAVWLSMIPLTSPVAMMMRIPFEPPLWQVGLSMFLLAVFFVFTIWLAGRIYRTGILMYGKKPSYRDLWKWLRY